ncbi:MAG: PocR ligand-binding domain-containing protein, partial [Patescibacteria group bacterium]|nr:PocR ligand-binding domain-containing protein [Patescibacteria group bacterium]
LARAFNTMSDRLAQTIEGLSASEEKHKQIVENAIEGLFQTTVDGRILSASPAMARILGYRSPEDLMTHVTNLWRHVCVHPEDCDGLLADAAQSDHAVDTELQWHRKDGEAIWVSVSIQAVRDVEGRLLVMQGFLIDVTERRQTEVYLQRINRLQSVILNNSTVGIALVRNRVFEWVNPRMCELFGIPRERFHEASTRVIYPDDAAYDRVAEAYPILSQGNKAEFDLEMRKGDGSTFWCRLEGNALDASKPQEGSIWIWEDITERKRTEEALAKRIVALTQPLDASESICFDDLFEVADIQRIQDEFAAATSVASIITRPDGTPITSPSNFRRLCNIIRTTEKGRCNCYRSDAALGRCSEAGPTIQPCLSGGLWDAGAAIHVGGKHVANWLIGQVRDETQSEEMIRCYAREIGSDETELVEAFREVPAMSRARFEQVAQLLYTTASQLSSMAYQNVQQSRFIADRQRAEKELRRHRDHLEELIRERTAELLEKNTQLAQDVAERKRVELALQETSNYLNNLLDFANAPIIVWNPRRRVTRFNHAFEGVTGRTAAEVLGCDLDLLFPAARRAECLDAVRRATEGDRWEAVEIPIQHVDGTIRVLLCNSACLYEADGKTVTSIIAQGQDITERKRLEAEALQHQKLESVGQLAAGIAHEINTPTQFVGDNIHFLGDAFADLMTLMDRLEQLGHVARDADLAPELLDDIDKARTEADLEFLREEIPKAIAHSLDGVQRVSKIVNAMKVFSHPDVSEKMPTELNRAIETTVTVARNEWRYVAEMTLVLDPALPPIPCFPGEINQVLLNLIVNAAHAIGERLGPGATEKGVITITTKAVGNMVEVRVADTGTGIPAEHRENLFTPFFTTKAVGKGTGQGLAMAYSVIHNKHQGTICFETEVGVGTTFIIRLPCAGQTPPSDAKAPWVDVSVR